MGATKYYEEYVPRIAMEQILNLSNKTLNDLADRGIIKKEKINGLVYYNTVETIQNYIQYVSARASKKGQVDKESGLKEKKLKAEIALKESQGELHRLRTEIAQGNYIPVEEVKQDYNNFFVVFKNFAMSLPAKLAGQFTGYVDPEEVRRIEKEIQVEVKKQLDNFVARAVVEEPKMEDEFKPKKMGRPRKNATKPLLR